MTEMRGPSVSASTLRQSTSSTVPRVRLPLASPGFASRSACQLPMSDQPIATGTTAARTVFSITA